MSYVIEWLSELADWQLHLIFGLSLKDHDPILDPLLLILSKHKVLASQFFFSVILCDNDSDEQIH